MKQTTLRLLGGFRLSIDGEAVALPTRKAEALLAFLALRPDERPPAGSSGGRSGR